MYRLILMASISQPLIAAESYVETAEDIACYQQYNYHFDKTTDCFYRQADKIEQNIQKQIVTLEKNSHYNEKWLQQQRLLIEQSCRKEFYRPKETITHLQTAFCVRLGLSKLQSTLPQR